MDTKQLTLRFAWFDEAERLTEVAHAAKSFWGYAARDIERWRDELTFTPELIDRWPTWVAVFDDAVAGVAQLRTEPEFELEALWVDPSAIGQGVGRQLVSCVFKEVIQRKGIRLLIDADPNAEDFYLRLGTARIGEIAAPTSSDPERIRPLLSLSISDFRGENVKPVKP